MTLRYSATARHRLAIRLAVAALCVMGTGLGHPARAVTADSAPPSTDHVYTLDGWGGLHPAGTSPVLDSGAYWQGWDIARGFALLPDGSGGYSVDGWGGLHAAGAAAAVAASGYWQGWDIARGVALLPASTAAAPAGYVLDGWGGLHPFGGAPGVSLSAYFQGWDIARGFAILPDSTAAAPAGYVLDGWGGLHPFGGAPGVKASGYWAGWDIARGLVLLPTATKAAPAGYVVDGFGGLHPFGGAPDVSPSGYWQDWDIVRGLQLWSGGTASAPGGWTLDGWGGLHAFGSAPPLAAGAYWQGWDIARGVSGTAGSSGVRSVVASGVIQDVAFYKQSYPLSCEAAAAAMALSHEGVFRSQGALLSSMGIDSRSGYYDGNGTLHWGDPYNVFVGSPNGSEPDLTGYGAYYPAVARAIAAAGGYWLQAGTGITAGYLYQQVLAGHPVIAWIAYDWRYHGTSYWIAWDGRRIPWAGPLEHAVLVVGASSSAVYVYNPASGPSWISRSTFESAYATYHQMAVVVS
ncbi:MAG TPA: C39 family peptidase [Candidatus Dormibacteraeota bacterium]